MNETDFEDNDSIYKKLSITVVNQFFDGNDNGRIKYGPLEINDYSTCFGINGIENSGTTGLYVKIPKVDLFLKNPRTILPLTDADRKFAEAEYSSLVHLSKFWQSDDIGVSFVKPISFLKDYNAIITRRIYAKDFFKFFRKDDLAGRLGLNKGNRQIRDVLFRIGTALHRFHKTSLKDDVFRADGVLKKIEYYCACLTAFGISNKFCNNAITKIKGLDDYRIPIQLTKTLKGLDIRNVLIDDSYHIYMLDPGKMKEDCREMDIARFIVTCRILYWGGLIFFLRFSPDKTYEESFLDGYSHCMKNNKILNILIIKELLKHWYTAHVVLKLKPWPVLLKRFLKCTYINPFYYRQIGCEINRLEE